MATAVEDELIRRNPCRIKGAGQSSTKAAMRYQHSDVERQKEVADGINSHVQAARLKAKADRAPSQSGTQRARDAERGLDNEEAPGRWPGAFVWSG
ncbi:hypothetical protein GCM10009864_20060 [Streptomyces lunalinharesii]|uniref:Integrase n=1 Tax=Streptomyces lunalinharesii TaxID=333384 RepID=A0ABN3RL26_9ACTN